MLCCVLVLVACPRSAPSETPGARPETVIRLTVQPMDAPHPALRYLLLPELKEMNPGNPIPNYLRSATSQELGPDQQVPGYAALRQADRAARMDRPDWQILIPCRTEGIGLLLPDVQKMRTLAHGLQERFRREVAVGRFDDALVTAKTLFAMSRHLSEHPTLIGDLVGIAVAFTAIGPLEEMLEQPGCPNLYWALTNLPHPLVPLDNGCEGERLLLRGEFRELDEHAPMSTDQIGKLVAHLDGIEQVFGTRTWLAARTKTAASVRAARRRLVKCGIPQERVERFPADQVFLLDAWREFEVQRDEVMKLSHLPAWQFEAQFRKNDWRPSKETGPFARLFLPAFERVRRGQARLDQRIALLRHVEALRLYAATHDGQLPRRLEDVAVPLSEDPFTGKPFRYTVSGATAHLRGSPPAAEEANPLFNVHYEITIRK
jgi:hypothetical protein